MDIKKLTIDEPAYPALLKQIKDPPKELYYAGDVSLLSTRCVAIVGSRKFTAYGRRIAGRIAGRLAACGVTVVSGMAIGIDGIGHRSALEAGGRTIAVLGNGLDVMYPAANRELKADILRRGLLISEYPPGMKGTKYTFPQRNRIISGLSVGVLVVEAPETSGSLITAARAAEQGRDVFAVPGNIDAVTFRGSNLLIRDGAALVTSGWELLSAYRWRFPRTIQRKDNKHPQVLEAVKRLAAAGAHRAQSEETKKPVDKEKGREYIDMKAPAQLSEDELAVIYALSSGPKERDEIIQSTGMDTSDVLSALTLLELAGLVRSEEGQRYALAD